MAPLESVFSGSSPGLAEIVNAIEKIESLISAKKLKKKLIFDMLLGLRILEQSLQRKQIEAFELVIKWISLFLKIQSSICTQDEVVRGHFEKVVPSAVTYMIGCLQYKPKGITSYHYQLLEMINELLTNVRPEVLDKLANFETGIIACVWFPINFVGDFNTQMMALRLLVMLLKCVDSTRLQNELNAISCSDKSVLKNKLTAAIAVANFHAAKFENTARELLNTYNMHLAKNILVYSFRCKTFKFGENIEFFKPMNADHFWIDFNYSPRTLSFNGRCQTNDQATYTNCSVSLQIVKLTLDQVNLFVQFQAPAQLIKNTNDFPDINNITTAHVILPQDEARRLLENKFVVKYYNKNHRVQKSNLNSSIVRLHNTLMNNCENIEDGRERVINSNVLAFDSLKSGNINVFQINMENKENMPPKKTNTTTTNPNRCFETDQPSSSKQFQRSYDFLIGNSEGINVERTETKNDSRSIPTFKLPHTPNLEKQFRAEKLSNPQKVSDTKIVNYTASSSDSTDLNSENTKASSKRTVKNSLKRFFKSHTPNSDDEYNPSKSNKVPRKRNTRNKRPNTTRANTTSKKSKQINEVRPMLQSNTNLNISESATCSNQPLQKVSTNANTQDIIRIDIGESGTSNVQPDIYENQVVSDAEPGQSYRNFTIRRISNEKHNGVHEAKRARISLPRAVKNHVGNSCRLVESRAQISRKNKTPIKRSSPESVDPFDALKTSTNVSSKVRKIEAATTNNINQSLPSAVDMTYPKQDKVEIRLPEVGRSCEQVNNEVIKASTQPYQKKINIQEVSVNNIHCNSSATSLGGVIEGGEIQECRRDVGQNEMSIAVESDEFSDFPTFPNIMGISDLLPSDEYDSTNNATIQTVKTRESHKTNVGNLSAQNENTKMLESHRSLIYYSRSENDSDSEQSTISNSICEQPVNMQEHVFVTPQVPFERFRKTTSLTKCQVTTTATSIITQQDRFVHHKNALVNLTPSSNTPLNLSKSCARTTTKTTTKTIVKERNELSFNSYMRRSVNIRTPTTKVLRQESSIMIANYTNSLKVHLDHFNNNVKKNCANTYIKKSCDIAERMINEIERERVSLLELEANVERLSRQLSWQCEAYQRKTQQFECFKQNIETLLSTLDNINILKEIKTDTQNKIQQLQETSESIAAQQWRDFINESTENLLKDISSLSNL